MEDNREEKNAESHSEELTDPEMEVKELYEEHEEEEAEIMEYVPRLTPKWLKFWQIFLGWLAGFLIWFFMALGVLYPDNLLMSWAFLIVFAVAMFGRNAIERRTGLELKLFMRHFLISLIVFLVIFVILGPVTHILDTDSVG